MSRQYKSLIEARDQWQSDIKMYKDFLKGESKTFEGRYGAEEYISMAENRLNVFRSVCEYIFECRACVVRVSRPETRLTVYWAF